MSGILSTSLSGLLAAQRSLETVQHNIANADKPGYSRQRVELATKPAQFTGDGYIGQGVNVANVTRSYDQFITKQLSSSQSTFSDVDRYHQLAAQVDNMMVDSDTSLAPVMKSFFDAVTEVATDPASVPPRQVLLGQAETMVQSFHGMSARFQEIRTLNNNDMGAAVKDINSIASSLANLNVQIVSELGKSQGTKQPNDLLDQRDALLAKLSELVTVSVLPQRDGSTSVFVGSGQMLVQGNLASTFSTFQSQTDPDRLLIGVQGINGVSDITTQISGGALAGALRFRDEVLDPAQQKLGRIAAGLAMSFNAVHQKGFDLNGVAGTALFNFSGNSVIPTIQNVQNTGNALVSANYQDVNLNPNAAGNLDYSDFTLNYVNAGGGVDYTLTRARDNQVINLTATDTVPPTNVFTLSYAAVQPANTTMTAVPGIDITVDMSGGQTISVGDKFAIRPTYDAAQKIGVTTSDPQKIAAATNIEIDPLTKLPVPKFDAFGAPVLDASGNPVYVTINGPMPGDNRNALQLADLENKLTMIGGSVSLSGAHDQLVSGVATSTRAAEIGTASQEALLNQAKASWESLAGVNLDEEAANLMQFQQAYQASAQAISIAKSLFDTLIGAVR